MSNAKRECPQCGQLFPKRILPYHTGKCQGTKTTGDSSSPGWTPSQSEQQRISTLVNRSSKNLLLPATPSAQPEESLLLLDEFPDDILLTIFQFLPVSSLLKHVNQVCSRWRHLARDPMLWTHLVFTGNCPNSLTRTLQLHPRPIGFRLTGNFVNVETWMNMSRLVDISRLETLSIQVSQSYSPGSYLNTLLQAGAKCLTELHLSWSVATESSDMTRPILQHGPAGATWTVLDTCEVIAKGCTALQMLSMRNFSGRTTAITAGDLRPLYAEQSTLAMTLQQLDISGNEGMIDSADDVQVIGDLLQFCKQLRGLRMKGGTVVKDQLNRVYYMLSKKARSLETLAVPLPPEGLDPVWTLYQMCPRLATIDMDGFAGAPHLLASTGPATQPRGPCSPLSLLFQQWTALHHANISTNQKDEDAIAAALATGSRSRPTNRQGPADIDMPLELVGGQLVSLNICSLPLKTVLLSQFPRLRRLQMPFHTIMWLNISDCPLLEISSATLQMMPRLAAAALHGTPIKELKLSDMKNLVGLELDRCEQLQSIELPQMSSLQTLSIQNCPSLSHIDIRWCRGLKRFEKNFETSRYPLLETLLLSNSSFTVHTLAPVIRQCGPHTRVMDISYLAQSVTDDTIFTLCQQCPNLQELNLYNSRCITAAAANAMAQSWPMLKSLNLVWCKKIPKDHAKTLFAERPNVELQV
eukprot:GFYU01000756.1.p1 GENE.GFYU01000756.1~~GFYU01000756.1.p1  ORF type:complete len:696 (+),score=123.53 GFYU01000756.1:72-2159(+)